MDSKRFKVEYKRVALAVTNQQHDQIQTLGGIRKVLGLAFADVQDGKKSIYTDLAEAIL